VSIEPHPDQLAKGIDSQLEKAVEVVKADVVAWKKKREPTVAVKTDKPVENKAVPVTVPKK
jgi:hypothetical protein